MRRLRRILGISLVTVLLLEACLQILALAVWWLQPGAPDAPDEGRHARVVLCVGDSFTYGLGGSSSEQSYPAVLKQRIRATLAGVGGDGRRRGDWRVVNQGWPGRNSREILERLDGWLLRYRPRVVCVIAGSNDLWSRPDELLLPPQPRAAADPVASDREPFRWECRTLRLLRTMRAWRPWRGARDREGSGGGDGPAGSPGVTAAAEPNDRWSAPDGDPLVGRWTAVATGRSIEFHADGTCLFGPKAGVWRRDGRRLWLETGGVDRLHARWERTEAGVLLHFDGGPEPLGLIAAARSQEQPPMPAQEALAAVHWAVARGRFELIDRILQRVPAGGDAELELRSALVTGCCIRGESPRAMRHLEVLRRAHAERPDEVSTSCLASSLDAFGAGDEALRLARETVGRYPDSADLWRVLAVQSMRTGDHDTARTAIDRAVSLLGDGDGHSDGHSDGMLAHLLGIRARLHRGSDSTKAAESLARIWLLLRDEPFLRRELTRYRPDFDRSTWEQACRRAGVPDPDWPNVARAYDDAVDDRRGDHDRVLHSHLVQIVERCRRRGCEPVLGSYPHEHMPANAVLAAVAAELGAGWVPVHRTFAQVLQRDPAAELFAADGHCNDNGYALMGDAMARGVRAAIGAR